jgi:hypothetical protein
MSENKHKVATDALETLGTHPIPDNSGRDAIHLAVEPVTAGHVLSAGQRIKIDSGFAVAASHHDAIGIVDPFLIDLVQSGQKFWLVVFPRQITSLRHVWSHPAFPEEATYHVESDEHYVAPSPAEKWLREYADKIDEPFEALIEGADTWVRNGSYFYGSPCGEPGDVYFGNLEGIGTDPDFWPHYEAYRQTTVPADKQRSFFTCSC